MNNIPIKKRSRDRFETNCLQCNTLFSVASYRKDTTKYCSRKCLGLGSREKHTTVCIVCNSEFQHIACRANKAKYCSRQCYHKGQTKKGTVKKKCEHCSKEYLTSPSKEKERRFCSRQCINKSIKEEWKPGFGFVRGYMKTRGLISSCERCGYNEFPQILGVHHKDRNRKNNEISNLEVLCANCHSVEHNRHTVHGFKE